MTRAIDLIVVHCSATPNGRPTSIGDIDRMHAQRGFHRSAAWMEKYRPELRAVGYHFFISISGEIFEGRHVDEVGAHAQGFNAASIGICMAGTDRYTNEQWDALNGLTYHLLGQFPTAQILGHRDLSPDLNGDGEITSNEWVKTCPGFDVTDWMAHRG